jgi:predicted metalloprotease with PDZ domain
VEFGEWDSDHREAAKKLGPATIMIDTIYAVGLFHKFITNTPLDDGRMRKYGFYWFGQPTLFNAPEIAKEVESAFTKMAQFFEDTELSYRVFVRFNPERGFGGGAFLRSFILEYDPFVELADGEMLSLLVHDMVHNWPHIEGSAHKITQDESTWYTECNHLP